MITVGLDLHKRYITACALDDAGTVLAEHRRLEPSLDALGRWLGGLGQPVLVAMEATLYWHWLERQLTARGVAVQVAHPYQVKLIWQARTQDGPGRCSQAGRTRAGEVVAGDLDSRSRDARPTPAAAGPGLPRQAADGDAQPHSRLSDRGKPALSGAGSVQQGRAGLTRHRRPAVGRPRTGWPRVGESRATHHADPNAGSPH